MAVYQSLSRNCIKCFLGIYIDHVHNCSFISYRPFVQSSKASGESVFKIKFRSTQSLLIHQSIWTLYSLSDFIWSLRLVLFLCVRFYECAIKGLIIWLIMYYTCTWKSIIIILIIKNSSVKSWEWVKTSSVWRLQPHTTNSRKEEMEKIVKDKKRSD